jgi:hypothetical protein
VPDHHHRLPVEPRPPGDDRAVVAEEAVAVELDEVGEGEPEVVEGEGAPARARDLHALQRGEVAVDLEAQVGELLLERDDLRLHVDLAVAGEPPELVDLLLELRDGLLEIEGRCGH